MTGGEMDAWVRAAGPADGEVVARHGSQASLEGTRYRGSLIDLRLDVREDCCLVAGFGATPMASLVASRDPGLGWVIERIYVEESAREVGLGDALLREFLGIVRASSQPHVLAQAQPGDRSTKNLFERHGLVARTILVGCDLSDRSSEADASR